MVRHKGFIPWDDDLDFVVPRSFIGTLLSSLEKELPPYYVVRTLDDDIGIWGEIIKIEDARTLIIEEGNAHPHSVFIDIFPLDYAQPDSLRDRLLWTIMMTYSVVFSRPKSLIARLVNVIGALLGKNWLIHIVKYIVPKDGKFLTVYSGRNGKQETQPLAVFGTPTLYPFENTHFYGIEKYEIWLREIYGDYMQLPPADKRHVHIMKMYYK